MARAPGGAIDGTGSHQMISGNTFVYDTVATDPAGTCKAVSLSSKASDTYICEGGMLRKLAAGDTNIANSLASNRDYTLS